MPTLYMHADRIYRACSSQVNLDDVDAGVHSCESKSGKGGSHGDVFAYNANPSFHEWLKS